MNRMLFQNNYYSLLFSRRNFCGKIIARLCSSSPFLRFIYRVFRSVVPANAFFSRAHRDVYAAGSTIFLFFRRAMQFCIDSFWSARVLLLILEFQCGHKRDIRDPMWFTSSGGARRERCRLNYWRINSIQETSWEPLRACSLTKCSGSIACLPPVTLSYERCRKYKIPVSPRYAGRLASSARQKTETSSKNPSRCRMSWPPDVIWYFKNNCFHSLMSTPIFSTGLENAMIDHASYAISRWHKARVLIMDALRFTGVARHSALNELLTNVDALIGCLRRFTRDFNAYT